MHGAIGIARVSVDPGERADPAACGPGAGALAVGDGDSLAALDQRQDLHTGDDDWLEIDHAASDRAAFEDRAGHPAIIII